MILTCGPNEPPKRSIRHTRVDSGRAKELKGERRTALEAMMMLLASGVDCWPMALQLLQEAPARWPFLRGCVSLCFCGCLERKNWDVEEGELNQKRRSSALDMEIFRT